MTGTTAVQPPAWGNRFQAWLTRRPEVMDAVVVVVVLAMALARYWDRGDAGPRPASPSAGSITLDVVVALLLLGRRYRPLAVFAAVTALTVAQAVMFTVEPGPAVLVALFALAAYDGRRRLVLAAVVGLEVGSVFVVLAYGEGRHDLALVLLLAGTITAAVALGFYQRTRRAYLASLVERAQRLEVERDQQVRLAAAAERARIARELHDVVAHSLTVMIRLTDGAAYQPGAPEPVRRALVEASAAGRQALGEMRRLLGVLRSADPPSSAPQPGLPELEQLVDQVRAAGLRVELVMTGSVPDLPASAGLTLYRIVQESLTNVRKHAPAASGVAVRIAFRGTLVEVEVTDDGGSPGSPRQGGADVAGHGLLGMRERIGLFGGDLQAGPAPAGGWSVLARWDVLAETADRSPPTAALLASAAPHRNAG